MLIAEAERSLTVGIGGSMQASASDCELANLKVVDWYKLKSIAVILVLNGLDWPDS